MISVGTLLLLIQLAGRDSLVQIERRHLGEASHLRTTLDYQGQCHIHSGRSENTHQEPDVPFIGFNRSPNANSTIVAVPSLYDQ